MFIFLLISRDVVGAVKIILRRLQELIKKGAVLIYKYRLLV